MAIKVVATTDYIGLTSGFPNSNGPLTVMYWFKMATVNAGDVDSVVLGRVSSDNWESFVHGPAGLLGLYSSDSGMSTGSALSVATWYSLAFTIAAGGAAKGYINGSLDIPSATLTSSGTPTSLAVGASRSTTQVDYEFYGLKIWNAELTAAEIATEDSNYSPVRTAGLYGSWLLPNVTTLTDDSGNGHHFTRNGSSFTNSADPQAKDVLATTTAGWIQG